MPQPWAEPLLAAGQPHTFGPSAARRPGVRWPHCAPAVASDFVGAARTGFHLCCSLSVLARVWCALQPCGRGVCCVCCAAGLGSKARLCGRRGACARGSRWGGGGGVHAPPLLWQRRLCMHSGAGCLCACNVAGVAASPLVWVPGTRPTCCGWVLRPQLRAIQISLLPCQNFQDGSTLSCCHWHFPFTSCERMGFDACHSIMYREPGRRHAAGNA